MYFPFDLLTALRDILATVSVARIPRSADSHSENPLYRRHRRVAELYCWRWQRHKLGTSNQRVVMTLAHDVPDHMGAGHFGVGQAFLTTGVAVVKQCVVQSQLV